VYRLLYLIVPASACFATTALGVTSVVGDPDGFGISPTSDLVAANGDPADSDGDGIIEAGEYLPDWNQNGNTAINSADSFDFRSAAELNATDGAQWTDRAVEGGGAADGAEFIFQFEVPEEIANDHGTTHFINFVFGDYDVNPTSIDIDGITVNLTLQGSGEDGLVQAAYAEVPWSEMADGEVVIRVHAPNEPYLTFDYALLDLFRLVDVDGDGIPGSLDNCPTVPNLDQLDSDGDGVGDVCDLCPDDLDSTQIDTDGDGLGDVCDPCPLDGTSDATGPDGDGDGYCLPADCDDSDAEVSPAAEPGCDPQVDRNCDGIDDLSQNDCGDDDDSAAGDDDDSANEATDEPPGQGPGAGAGNPGGWGEGCNCGSTDEENGRQASWALLAPLLGLSRRRRRG
tara:strand:+ start:4082 stop:5275 length:1194 start_codon:yes stop_codon:yes gene_type:complete